MKELIRKMASPRAKDCIALKGVARYAIKFPRMACRYSWTELDCNIEVFGDEKFAGCVSLRKSTIGEVAGVVQSHGHAGLKCKRIRTGSCCPCSIRGDRSTINQVRCNCCNWDGTSTWTWKSSTFDCWRSVGAAPRSFGENSSLQNGLIIHSLKPITSGMLGSVEVSTIQADVSETWVTVSGGDAEFIKKRRSKKTVEFRTRREKGFMPTAVGLAVCLISLRKIECFRHALVEPCVLCPEASAFRARLFAQSHGGAHDAQCLHLYLSLSLSQSIMVLSANVID